ncbi:hypothetical protein [Nocardia sp. IFM 10818]
MGLLNRIFRHRPKEPPPREGTDIADEHSSTTHAHDRFGGAGFEPDEATPQGIGGMDDDQLS